MRRTFRLPAVLGALAVTTMLVTSCSSSKSSDTTVAAETTAAPATDTTAVAETTVAAETAAETAAAATDTTVAADTAAASDTAAAGDSTAATLAADSAIAEQFVAQMLTSLTGATTADPADVKCVSSKIDPAGLGTLMSSAGASDAPSDAMKSVVKAVFTCKPKGLGDSLVSSAFTDMPASVTAEQKSCIADKFLSVVAENEAILDAMLSNADSPPAELKAKFEPVITECVPAGADREALLKEIRKA